MVASPNSGNSAKAIAETKRKHIRRIGQSFQAIEKILMNECYHTPKVIRAHAALILACDEVVNSLLIDYAAKDPASCAEGPSNEVQMSFEGSYLNASSN